jgi:hypothetical protein
MKPADMNTDVDTLVHLKALIYGRPGTGKTTFAVSAPKPLILLSERQALTNIRHAIKRTGAKDVQVLVMESLEDYRSVLRTLYAATANPSLKSGPFVVRAQDGVELYRSDIWPETIAIDSLTDATKFVEDEINREAPPRKGKDGLDVVAERYWQALFDRCSKVIRAFRDVDFHVLYLCLEDDRVQGEGDEAERQVTPQLPMRKLPGVVSAAVNVVGIMTRGIRKAPAAEGEAPKDAEIVYVVRTVGPQHFMLKPYRPLADVEEADFTSWVRRINAAITAGDEAPEAKPTARTNKPKNSPKPTTTKETD